MKQLFWYEKWVTDNWVFYLGRISNFKIGLNFGLENDLYLGWFMIGFSNL